MILITEFIRRIQEGYAEAVLCRAENGRLYVVKTRLSGKDTLVKERLCACIGRAMGLPIPADELVLFAGSRPAYSVYPEAAALADCPGFGSSLVKSADRLAPTSVPQVDPGQRAAVLLFDWWIVNADRTDDNPNLLWLPSEQKLHVIDHNLAFGTETADEFRSRHIFRGSGSLWDDDYRDQMASILADIIDRLPEWWRELPPEWTDGCIVQLGQVVSMLKRCETDEFWERL